jgi:DNA-directed RNA polymerase subunit RPC12/RpoP
MTREEKLDWLYRLRSEIYVYMPKDWCIPMHKALNMAIDTLEQQPCEDAISREAVLDTTICEGISCNECSFNEIDGESGCLLHARIDELPSVTQKSETVTEFADICRECGAKYGKLLKQKKGHWIETEYHRWRCSVCREKGMSEWDNIHDVRTNFCPDCGAKMESEYKE